MPFPEIHGEYGRWMSLSCEIFLNIMVSLITPRLHTSRNPPSSQNSCKLLNVHTINTLGRLAVARFAFGEPAVQVTRERPRSKMSVEVCSSFMLIPSDTPERSRISRIQEPVNPKLQPCNSSAVDSLTPIGHCVRNEDIADMPNLSDLLAIQSHIDSESLSEC